MCVGNINSSFESSKLSQVFHFLYLYKYFLFQITTNEHAILTNRETVSVHSSHCEWISKQFTRSIWFLSFFLSRNKRLIQVAKINSKSDKFCLLPTRKYELLTNKVFFSMIKYLFNGCKNGNKCIVSLDSNYFPRIRVSWQLNCNRTYGK